MKQRQIAYNLDYSQKQLINVKTKKIKYYLVIFVCYQYNIFIINEFRNYLEGDS